MARNQHADAVATCPLLRDERTWLGRGSKSENDHSDFSAAPDILDKLQRISADTDLHRLVRSHVTL